MLPETPSRTGGAAAPVSSSASLTEFLRGMAETAAPVATLEEQPDPLARHRAMARARLEDIRRGKEKHSKVQFAEDDLTLGELQEREFPPPSWIYKNVLNTDALVCLGAQAKLGKTFHGGNIFLNIAAGGCLWGQEDMPCLKPGPVYMFFAEDNLVHVRNRINAMMLDLTVEQRAAAQKNLCVLPRQTTNLMDEEVMVEIIARVMRHSERCGQKTVALYLDPFIKLFRMTSENDNAEMEQAMMRLHLIKEALDGITILYVHHAGKGGEGKRGGEALRGASSMQAAYDGAIFMRKVFPEVEKSLVAVVSVETKNGMPMDAKLIEPCITDDADGYVKRLRWRVEEPSEENGGIKKSWSGGGGKKPDGGGGGNGGGGKGGPRGGAGRARDAAPGSGPVKVEPIADAAGQFSFGEVALEGATQRTLAYLHMQTGVVDKRAAEKAAHMDQELGNKVWLRLVRDGVVSPAGGDSVVLAAPKQNPQDGEP